MHGRGQPVGLAGHMLAALALALAGMLVGWILAGGEPFGRIIGSDDVSAPTRAAPPALPAGVALPVNAASRLVAEPPARRRAKRAKPAAPQRERPRPKRRKRPGRVVAPAPPVMETPVVAAASPEPTAAPAPAAAPAPPAAAPRPAQPKKRRAERSRPAPGAGAGEG